MEEVTYFQEAGSVVTSARVVLGGATYATRNISSVRLIGGKISYVGLFLLLISVITIVKSSSANSGDSSLVVLFSIFAIGCAAWVWQQYKKCKLMMNTSGSENLALETTNKAKALRIHDAIAKAISAR